VGDVLGALALLAVAQGHPPFSIFFVEGVSCYRDRGGRALVAIRLAIMALGVAVALLVGDIRLDAEEGIGQLDPFDPFLVSILVDQVPVQ
jgi:hypothetical protein